MYIHSFFMLMMMMLSVYKCRKFRKFLYMYIRFDRFYFSLSCINLVHIYVFCVCIVSVWWWWWDDALHCYIYIYVCGGCVYIWREARKKIGEERFECVFCFGLRSVCCCWSDEDSQFLFLWCFVFGFFLPSLSP